LLPPKSDERFVNEVACCRVDSTVRLIMKVERFKEIQA
jgi:hypothetical protein